MLTNTFIKRIGDLLTKKGSLKASYYIAIKNINLLASNRAHTVYPLSWSKNSGHYKLEDTTYKNIINIFRRAGVDYITGNDAPRGGKEGIYIKLTNKGKKQLKGVDLEKLLVL